MDKTCFRKQEIIRVSLYDELAKNLIKYVSLNISIPLAIVIVLIRSIQENTFMNEHLITTG